MRINRNICAIMAVAGLGYAAGQFDLFPGGTTIAAQHSEKELSPELQAMAEAGAPGENHKLIDSLVGEFEAEWRIWMDPTGEPFTSRGTVTREWVLGGRYIKETVEADSDMGHFSGIGYIGYSNIESHYEVVWMDSTSTSIMRETGTLDPDSMVMKTRSKVRDPLSGKLLNTRGTLDLSSQGGQTYIGYITGSDGKEFKHMEGVTVRR